MSSLRGGGRLGAIHSGGNGLLTLEVGGMKTPKPRKPRPTEIGQFICWLDGNRRIQLGCYGHTAKESRRLALWLTRAADYLEAKEGVK